MAENFVSPSPTWRQSSAACRRAPSFTWRVAEKVAKSRFPRHTAHLAPFQKLLPSRALEVLLSISQYRYCNGLCPPARGRTPHRQTRVADTTLTGRRRAKCLSLSRSHVAYAPRPVARCLGVSVAGVSATVTTAVAPRTKSASGAQGRTRLLAPYLAYFCSPGSTRPMRPSEAALPTASR